MRPAVAIFLLICAAIAFIGCESKRQKSARLQAEYGEAYKQYYKDCIAPANAGASDYFKGTKATPLNPQQLREQRQKCAAESARVKTLQEQITAVN